jgi:hypothetical protein
MAATASAWLPRSTRDSAAGRSGPGRRADRGGGRRLRWHHVPTGEVEAGPAVGPLPLTARPRGLPGSELDDDRRRLLAALVSAYVGRVPDGLVPPVDLDGVHLAWAGSTDPGRPHYHRLQGPRLLAEWDNTQRGGNHAHSVWRDPEADFGLDALADHRARHHRG